MVNKNVNKLANSIGSFIEYWGFKAIDGKVWTLIFLSEKPISTPEIVKRLGSSKALISVAINELLAYELIFKENKISHGAQTYSANLDLVKTIQKVLKQRELKKITEAEKLMLKLSRESKDKLFQYNISKDKLSQLEEITKAHKDILSALSNKKIITLTNWIKTLKTYKKILK